METNYQKIVCFQIYGKRYSKLSGSDQGKVNAYINYVGHMQVKLHPELIRGNYNEVLRKNRLSMVELEEEE